MNNIFNIPENLISFEILLDIENEQNLYKFCRISRTANNICNNPSFVRSRLRKYYNIPINQLTDNQLQPMASFLYSLKYLLLTITQEEFRTYIYNASTLNIQMEYLFEKFLFRIIQLLNRPIQNREINHLLSLISLFINMRPTLVPQIETQFLLNEQLNDAPSYIDNIQASGYDLQLISGMNWQYILDNGSNHLKNIAKNSSYIQRLILLDLMNNQLDFFQ